MTDYGESAIVPTRIRADGINLDRLVEISAGQQRRGTDTSDRFWSTNQRSITSTDREVMEVTFGGRRLINHLAFQVSRFPLVLTIEWQDDEGNWRPFRYAMTSRSSALDQVQTLSYQTVRMALSESVPAMVDSAQTEGHAQHYGLGHWQEGQWKTIPVTTDRIRVVMVRNHRGTAPKNPLGQEVAYSLAVRDLQVGYRVSDREDVPRYPLTDEYDTQSWASAPDLVGSRVAYSMYEQGARKAIDGSAATAWRSDPQPVNYSVVNFYLDVRTPSGEGQVIDRFYVDPLTLGVHCNVYYSSDEPEGDYLGTSDEIPYPARIETGSPEISREGSTGRAVSVDLHTDPAGVEVANTYLRMRYDQPWWVGIDARAAVAADAPDEHPIISLGSHRLIQHEGGLHFVTQAGETVSVPLDPEIHVENARYLITLAYYQATLARESYIRLTYQAEHYEPVVIEQAIEPLEPTESPVRVGMHPNPETPGTPAINIMGLVVKSEHLTDEVEQWFRDEGHVYVQDAPNVQSDRGTATNARIRLHPMFLTESNLFGIVGGPGDRYEEMVWTPVTRDYTLRQGYLYLPPTKARYWKFEFSQLAPEVYESFLPIQRTIRCWPAHVVNLYNQVGPRATRNTQPFGVETTSIGADANLYADAIESLRRSSLLQDTPGSYTEALVVKDPNQAAQAAETGWIWQYQPWHLGSHSPQFITTGRHTYEKIKIWHKTKVAFFAGLRELTPYRVDYSFDDDTDEYVEPFLDLKYIDSTEAMTHYEGGVISHGPNSRITSTTLASYKTVRGVQFATQETDAIQVLTDPRFSTADLDAHWNPYGDASLRWNGQANVAVRRGWQPRTYGDLNGIVYGDLDGQLYGALEGNNPDTGYAEGGISSKPYSPSGAGRILALVEISTQQQMSGPIQIEIVSTHGDIVVGSTTKRLLQGEASTVKVGYSPGILEQRYTYGDIEDFLNVKAAEGGGVEYLMRGAGDGDDATSTTAPEGSPDASYGEVNLTTDAGAPPQWDLVTGLVLHVRYRSPAAFTFTALDDALAPIFTPVDAPASDEVVNQIDLDLPLTPGDPAPFSTLVALSVAVTLPADRPLIEVVDWWVEATTIGGQTTYGSLEKYRYGDLESGNLSPDVYVRVRQPGTFSDSFNVHKIALYDSPVTWSFSVDDGLTWYAAMDVRNDPNGVLIFPEPGTKLRWRAEAWRENASISALTIRPWYGSRSATAEPAHEMDSLGPTKSVWDTLPPLHRHPMWLDRFNPIEDVYLGPEPVAPFWRNIVLDPGAESADSTWTATGGTVETGYQWVLQHNFDDGTIGFENNAHHGRYVARFVVGPEPEPVLVPGVDAEFFPGDVSVSVNPTRNSVIVGDSNQWGDDNDDSYAEVWSSADHLGIASAPVSGFDADPASVSALSVAVRLETGNEGGVTDNRVVIEVLDANGTTVGQFVAVLATYDPQDLLLESMEAGYTAQAVAAALAEGGTVRAYRHTIAGEAVADRRLRVYDLSLTVTYTETFYPTADPCTFLPQGPADEQHRSVYAIDGYNRTVAAQMQVAGDVGVWVQPWAHYLTWDAATGSFVEGLAEPVAAPVRTSTIWHEFAFSDAVPQTATHWEPRLHVTANDPRIDRDTRPPEGTQVFADCVFVPDNGLSVSGEPYLDGDQPGAVWQGLRHNSPSIYDPNPEPVSTQSLFLGEGLVL